MRDAYRVKGKRKEEKGRTQWEFIFDALGRNVQQIILRLLPCQALESAENRQSAEVDPLRFKIAGILTKYKGNHYLLLERMIFLVVSLFNISFGMVNTSFGSLRAGPVFSRDFCDVDGRGFFVSPRGKK
ncbi:hypothetical protein ES703_94829 [subsurface metagenome]